MADSNDPKTADEGTLRNSDNEEECKVASDEKADPKPAAEDISEDKIDEEKKCNVESDEKADPKTADENISSKADEEKECNVGSDERADPRPADAGTMSKKEEEKECNVEPGDKADPNPAAEDISDKIDGEKECKVESDEKSDPKPAAEYISEDNIDEEKECNVGSDEKADPKAAVEDTPSKSDQEKECNGESDEKAESNTAVEDSSSKSAQEKEYNGKMDEKTNEGSWIERSPDLIRLTGEYPFNSEPPLTELMKHGFTTPAEYHYVRNHGSVPRATWDKWTVEVSGLVDQPTHFTMSQLERDFQALTRQVTLVCSGNRRMEQNMVKPTNGFHWGAAAVSTSEWHGARLKDVLEKCGVQNGAVYVCFEGAEELSGGSKYGTSVKKEIAMDPTRDIIIAYKQGGEYLKPDHG